MLRRWLVLFVGVALMAVGLLAWSYAALTSRTQVETRPVPAMVWTAYP